MDRLEAVNNQFFKVVESITDWDREVPLFGKKLPKYAIIEIMIRHETLHHGQFIAFGYLLGVSFPQSWIEAWALPNNSRNAK